MKSRLFWRLLSAFVAVLMFFTIVLGSVYLLLFRQHTITINQTQMEKKAVSIAQTLSAFLTGEMGMPHGMGGYGAYLRYLDDIAMADVWIVDRDLNLLSYRQSGSTYSSLPVNAEQVVRRIFEGEVIYSQEFSGFFDTPSLTVGAPITQAGGQVIGAVLLHSPVSGIDHAVRQGLSALVAGAAIALLLAGATAAYMTYYFTKPLYRIKATALQLAYGDYTAQTSVTQQDEIGQLAQTIDLLAGRLSLAAQERAALDKLKEDFVANISHELRTPVAVLRGSLEVLKDGTIADPLEVADYYDQMLSESRYLERLVNDLLDLSRLQDPRFKLDMQELNLCDVLTDAARAIRQLLPPKQLTLDLDYPEEECMILGDYGRIRQLLLILLDNAVKFCDYNSVLTLRLSKSGSNYRLSVINNGQTIPQQELPYIFDRFRKTNSSYNKSGTGLGLSIAKQIADRHKAMIQVSSDQGLTDFTLSFPFYSPSQSE